MKKFFKLAVLLIVMLVISGCSAADFSNASAAANYQREAESAKYTSEYAKTVNKLEMSEGNFSTYRRVVFYNVRLGETVFVCEGYCHVQLDKDGDIELVIKTGPQSYLRHYLGTRTDITYFSEQLQANTGIDSYRYTVNFNPKLWFPDFYTE